MTDADASSRRSVRVVAADLHTPRMLRLVVAGDLSDWPEPGPAAQIELFIHDTPSGPVRRWYSVRNWDRERGELAVEMALNDGHGPATQWACRVVIGMRLEISSASRSTFQPAAQAGSYLFAGDEAAVPAIATCLASLPARARAVALLKVDNPEERQEFVSNADIRVRWLYRTGNPPNDGLAQAIAGEVAAGSPSAVWLALEAQVAGSVKNRLLAGGYPSGQLSVWEYWKRDAPATTSQPRRRDPK